MAEKDPREKRAPREPHPLVFADMSEQFKGWIQYLQSSENSSEETVYSSVFANAVTSVILVTKYTISGAEHKSLRESFRYLKKSVVQDIQTIKTVDDATKTVAQAWKKNHPDSLGARIIARDGIEANLGLHQDLLMSMHNEFLDIHGVAHADRTNPFLKREPSVPKFS